MFVGPVGFATHFAWPTLDQLSCSTAVMRPSFPPSFTRCNVAERLPAARFSSRRVRTQRTGARVRIERSEAMIEYFPTPPFEPNPPPM